MENNQLWANPEDYMLEDEQSAVLGEDFTAETAFLQKFDRILSSDMKIRITDDNHEYNENFAYTNIKKSEIFLKFKMIYDIAKKSDTDIYPEFIKIVKGLNFHELAHLMFTFTTISMRWKLNQTQIKIHNVMEDCRIETLFSEEYPITKNYFIKCINKFIAQFPKDFTLKLFPSLNDDEIIAITETKKNNTETKKNNKKLADFRNFSLAYLLTYGRKFYSGEFVGKVKEKVEQMMAEFEKDDNFKIYCYNLSDCEQIVDDYLVADTIDAQIELVKKLETEIGKLFMSDMREVSDIFGIASSTGFVSKNPNSKQNRNSKRMADKIKQKIKDFKKSMKGNKGKQDKPSDSEQEKQKLEKDLAKDFLNDLSIEDEKADSKVEVEIVRDIEQITNMKNAGNQSLAFSYPVPYIVQSEDKMMSQKLVNIIKKLRNDLKPSYVKKLKSGHIDLRRVLQESNRQVEAINVFRKYRHSKIDKTRLGVVILVDSSGSMESRDFKLALRSAYCIADALSKTGSKTMVITFETNFKIIKKFDEPIAKIRLERAAGGGTIPETAILYSEKELEKLKKKEGIKNMLLFMISDGQFKNSSLMDRTNNFSDSIGTLIPKLNKKMKTVMFLINFYNDSNVEKRLQELFSFYYKINNFDVLYLKMLDFVRKYETQVHRDILRWG